MILLDTSALVAHHREEPGAEMVAEAIASGDAWAAAPTWLELAVALAGRGSAKRVLEIYQETLAGTVDITAAVAAAAYQLRTATNGRLPAVDAMIAGAAKVRGYQLVHRDKHLAAIPQSALPQTVLPGKM